MRIPGLLSWAAIMMILSAAPSAAAEKRFEIGPRVVVVTAGGEPANDMISVGAYVEYRLGGGNWYVGGAIDQYSHDFERPWRAVGLQQDTTVDVIDASTDATVVSGWIGREYGRQDRRLRSFWTTGLGFSAPDTDDVSGPLEGGGMFDIATDSGSEIIVSATGGLRQRIGKRWSFQFALRADHHLADWKVVDRVSGNTGTIGGYTGLGADVAFGVRF